MARAAADEPRLAEAGVLLEGAAAQIEEALAVVARVRDDLEPDPQRLDELERRLVRIHDLARKHRLAPAELGAHRDRVAGELEQLRGAGQRLDRLEGEIDAAASHWGQAATALGATRRAAASALDRAVSALIVELGMGGGRFVAELEPIGPPRPDPNGGERVEFLVAANAGAPPRALRKVASGGELSRVRLALEVVLAGGDPGHVFIFDEVDAGIGGAVAVEVGRRLARLADHSQVIVVTHLAQVAAFASAHWVVSKSSRGEVTTSDVRLVGEDEREAVLAKMMGGLAGSESGVAHARDLLNLAQRR